MEGTNFSIDIKISLVILYDRYTLDRANNRRKTSFLPINNDTVENFIKYYRFKKDTESHNVIKYNTNF